MQTNLRIIYYYSVQLLMQILTMPNNVNITTVATVHSHKSGMNNKQSLCFHNKCIQFEHKLSWNMQNKYDLYVDERSVWNWSAQTHLREKVKRAMDLFIVSTNGSN